MTKIVLVVESDNLLRHLTCEELEQLGCQTLDCPSIDIALILLEQHLNVDVVLANVNAPGTLDIVKFSKKILQRWPGLPLILISEALSLNYREVHPNSTFLHKPWITEQLQASLRRVSTSAYC